MSSNDLFKNDDNFDDLIAAVDSLDFPLDDESNTTQRATHANNGNPADNKIPGNDPKSVNPFLVAAYKAAKSKPPKPEILALENHIDPFAALDSLEIFDEQSDVEFNNDATLKAPKAADNISNLNFEDSVEAALLDECADAQVKTYDPYAEFINDSDDELLDGFDGIESANELSQLFESVSPQTNAVVELHNTVTPESTVTEKPADFQQHVAEKRVADPFAAREVSETVTAETITLSDQASTPETAFLADSSEKSKSRWLSLYGFSSKFPKTYLGMCTVFALVGFAYILMLPALFSIAVIHGFEMLNTPYTDNMSFLLGIFFSISLFLFMAMYKLFDLKFVGPEGITLDEENAELLLQKIQSLKKEHRMPRIHQVVLTRRHELNIIKIPRFGLGIPVWSKNVLAIGYPFMQTLPEDYFNVALSRRLLQFTKRNSMLVNWLSFMRRTWTLYATSLKARNGVMDLLHYCFFAPYASMYRSFAVYLSQKDELAADEKTLSVCNDRDLLKTAQTIRLTQAMLVQYFWPKLNEALQDNLSSPVHIRPYHNLPGTLESLLENENVQSWFIRLAQETSNEGSAEAPFRLRMENMGHRKVSVPSAFDTVAAQHYFGERYEEMTDHMDQLWAEEVNKVLFTEKLEKGETTTSLPFHLSIEPA